MSESISQMKILGLGGLLHNASITLIEDDFIKLAVATERITRKKHTGLLCASELNFILNELGINLDDIDLMSWGDEYLFYKSQKADQIKSTISGRPCMVFKHHDCHAASSFYCSSFKEAIVITIDGKGDGLSAAIYLADKNGLHYLATTPMYYSLGRLWNAMNTMVGMKGYHNSGKTMALSGFGIPKYSILNEIIQFKTSGDFIFKYKTYESDFFFHKDNLVHMYSEITGLPILYDFKQLNQNYYDLVASLQELTNNTIKNLIEWSFKKVGRKPLCLAGGVALNTISNTFVVKELDISEIFIQPASSDEGLSLGAAILAQQSIFNSGVNIYFPFSPYLGRSYNGFEIENILKSYNLKWYKSNDIIKEAVDILVDKKILGWFQGREEFGPRALGNRSIIAHPGNLSIKEYLNKKIKKREWFRPFGPSIIDKFRNKYFKIDISSPYMLLSPLATSEAREILPAALHVDGTGRVQTVSEKDNPLYYRLLQEFQKRTGIGGLLNTSFNLHGEPIVGSPQDAVSCFIRSNLEYLIIGNYLVSK